MQWNNEPPSWSSNDGRIEVAVAGGTDFWRKTHYGFIRDNGHFGYIHVEGDFVAEVQVTGAYHELYDQAGLMLRSDAEHWIKTGIEYVHGVQYVSAVVTNDFSDWSVAPLADNPPTHLAACRAQGGSSRDLLCTGRLYLYAAAARLPAACTGHGRRRHVCSAGRAWLRGHVRRLSGASDLGGQSDKLTNFTDLVVKYCSKGGAYERDRIAKRRCSGRRWNPERTVTILPRGGAGSLGRRIERFAAVL